MTIMCGRVIQSSTPFRLAIVEGLGVRNSRVHNYPPRWNGAPSIKMKVALAVALGATSIGPAGQTL